MEIYIDNLALGSKSLKALEWLKNKLMKEFNMKNLRKAKKIIEWKITKKKSILKIDQKRYIQVFLESKK